MTQLFTRLYDAVIGWSNHRNAPWYLGALSFAESSFFPIPPDVMLAPMVLARRDRAWLYAALTTLMSVIGGLAGYLIGLLAIDSVMPLIERFGYDDAFAAAQSWFENWGFWAIFAAGFSPVPYKIFTIAAGAIGMPLAPFALASIVGRGARFYLVAGLIYWGGEPFERNLRKFVDWIGWSLVVLIVIAVFILRQ